MANISSLGLGSGIDAESIITQLMAVEKVPVTKATNENSKLGTKLSTWGKIQSSFSALKDASAALTKDSFWTATTATSSDDKSVAVTTSTSSTAGSYSIKVNKLAQAQYLASTPFTAKDAPVGEGTITIELGTFTANPAAPPAATFAAKAAASAVNIDIGPGDNTLEKIRDKINSSNSGVTASLVNDATGARLVLRGASGESNSMRISVAENGSVPGLSALAYDPSSDITNMSQTQAAGNAEAAINGVTVTSSTNTFSEVIDGLTIKVGKVSTDPVEVTVNEDKDSMKKGINAFVSAYNDIVSQIRVQTLYDADSKTAGPLQGDSTATGLLSQLRAMAYSSSTGSSVFSRFSDIGLSAAKDGTLSVDSTKLGSAMNKLPELKAFFATSDTTDPNKEGLGERFRKLAAQVTDADGSISTRSDGLKGTIKRNEDKITRLEEHNTLVENRLRAQYTALDQSMAKLNSLSTYVTKQLSALTSSS
jgi:flagellar hook-associated protein 2